MKRTILTALALTLVLVLALVAWLARDRSAPPVPVAGDPAADGARAPSVAIDPAASTAIEPAADESVARASAAPAAGAPAWDLETSIWVEGTVRAPAGCDDDDAWVYAVSREMDLDTLARLLEPRPWELTHGRSVLSRRKVERDGSFRLPCPPNATAAHVLLVGRYQYVATSVAVDVAAGARTIALEPECGACIAGTVTVPESADVASIEGLEIDLRTSIDGLQGGMADIETVGREATVAGGAFELRALPVSSRYELRLEPKTLAAATAKVAELVAGRTSTVRVALLRGGTIRGFVRGPNGPVADADVEAATKGKWFGFDNEAVRETKSNADGSFELPAVMPGKLVLRAKRKGWLEGDGLSVDVADGGTLSGVEIVLAQGASISGTLAWADGRPGSAIDVEVEFDKSQIAGFGAFNMLHGAEGSTTTDAEGRFTVGGLGKGPFTVKAAALPPGETIEDAKLRRKANHRARADGVQPGTSGLALVLHAPEGLAGRVLDETGAPVATGITVHAGRVGQGMLAALGQETLEDSFEDAEGRFLLTGFQPGTWKVYALAEGFAAGDPVQIEIPRAKDAPELVLGLVHAATVAGVVTSPDGKPVAGAKVELDTGEANRQRLLGGGPPQPEAESGADGTFVLEGLREGKVALVARAKEWAPSDPVELSLAPGARAEGVVVALRVGGRLTGEVYQDGGVPGAGMMVQLTEMKRFDQQMGFADGKGRFEFDHVAAGGWQVTALPTTNESASESAEDRTDAVLGMVSKMKTAMVTIVDGEEQHVVLGAPPADPVRVHGRVTHAGAPYGGALVTFVPSGGMKGMKFAQVAKDGSYSIVLDEPGDYSASLQKMYGGGGQQQNTIEFTCEIPKAEEHELDFALPTARISGVVEGPDRSPVAGARVSLHPTTAIEAGTIWGGQYTELATGPDGKYDIEALRPGTYTLLVGGTGMGAMFGGDDASHGREVRPGLKVSDGEWLRDVDFRLKKPGSCEVTVVDEAGKPVADAAIFVRSAEGALLDRFSFVATDSYGKRVYGGLAPGRYTFSSRKDGATSAESSGIKVEEAARASVQLVLQQGTMLLISVVGDDDKPLKASLSVQDDQGREVGGMFALSDIMKMFSEGDGMSTKEQRIGPVPPGKYKVKATLSDGRTSTKMVTLSGQPERKLTIRL